MERLLTLAVLAAMCLSPTAAADDTMEFDPEPEATEDSPAEAPNARALALYDKKQYEAATLLLFGAAGGDPAALERQHAEFLLGKSLFHLGFRAGSLVYFARIAEAGAIHRYRTATLRWLAALAPDLPGAVAALGHYSADELADPALADVRDQLAFWAGKSAYRTGNLGAALKHAARVGDDSEYATRARLLAAATRVRRGEWKRAIASFRSVADGDGTDKQREVARLQLARALYSNGQFDRSIAEYDRIEPSSEHWPTALFESSWAHLLSGDQSAKALGNLFSLDTPYLEQTQVPEGRWLEAIVYHRHCQYKRAVTAVRDFERELLPMRQELSSIARRVDDAAVTVADIESASVDAAYSIGTRRLLSRVLEDPAVRKARALARQLDSEIARVEAADPSWKTTDLASVLLQELSLAKSFADVDAGKAAGEALTSVRLELRELSRNGKKLRIDALERQGKDIESRARGRKPVPKNKRSRVPRDDEHYVWGSNGEIWRDEVGSYWKPITDRCPEPSTSR